jgi:hypothetical protein
MQIATAIEIAAPPVAVWAVLTDFAAYPDWNPFIIAIWGPLALGERLTVRIRPPNSGAMTFRPLIERLQPQRELQWRGHLLIPGLFDGVHRFQLEPLADGLRTRLHQDEAFSGLLAPLLMTGKNRDKTEAGFVAMNAALKQRAEAMAANQESRHPRA